ncbi:MAG TPA: glycosyltransferase family 39 protein [Terriglobales bacterium]
MEALFLTSEELTSSEGVDSFRLERGLALMLIGAAAIYLRVRNPLYSTAYMDESVYVVYGRMFLARHFESPLDTPLQWSFGWYLWPMMAAWADRLGGLAALREMAAILGVVTVAATYGFASRVFSKAVGLGAAAIMAVIAPAVFVSRIATRDSGSISFFALGLWAFAAAWKEDKKRYWILAGLCLFLAFLCKYLVAIYFPVLVLLALVKGWRPLLFLTLPLTLACAVYGLLHFDDLKHLLLYGSGYSALRAPDAWDIYVARRGDFWLLVVPAIVVLAGPRWRSAVWLWAGACLMLLFQWKSRADFDYWKHVNYTLLFMVPLAAAGVVAAITMLRTNYGSRLLWSIGGVLALASGVAWLGQPQSIQTFLFWPNVEPALAYFDGSLAPHDRVLVDDTVFRYYFQPPLGQSSITDPMYFHYRDSAGHDDFDEDAYKAAVREGAFSYVVMDGGMGDEARHMDRAIRPLLNHYQLQMSALDPVRGQKIEVYSRDTARTPGGPNIHLLSPASGALVTTKDSATVAEGVTSGAHADWYAEIEVFTNAWYPQGGRVPIAEDGSFHQRIYLGGQGPEQCYHLVRARLFDDLGHQQAITLNHGVARAGGPTVCNVAQANR